MKELQKLLIDIDLDLFKRLQEGLAPWKQNRKQWEMTQGFNTVMYIFPCPRLNLFSFVLVWSHLSHWGTLNINRTEADPFMMEELQLSTLFSFSLKNAVIEQLIWTKCLFLKRTFWPKLNTFSSFRNHE